MASRRRTGLMEDAFDLVAMFPWWAGVLLAIGLYWGLHWYAVQVVAPIVLGGQHGAAVAQLLFHTLARYLQYILPFVCLLGSVASARKVWVRKSLAQGLNGGNAAAFIDGMSWQEFELLVGEAFRQKGFKVLELGGPGPDGGVDLVLTKGREKYLVQCKQWRALKVTVSVVRELYGLMASKGAAGGFVVTSGKFTSDAKEFANGRNVTLVDGDMLVAMLQDARARRTPAALQDKVTLAPIASSPNCPKCASRMVRREAKRGPNSGNAFWGCATYPNCTGTMPIEAN